MKKLLFFLLVILAITSCKKDAGDINDKPPVDDTISFTIPETEDIVMYEVNLRALSETGDLQGVIGRLDEIKALGANVIWLMPIYPIGEVNSVNSPYCVKNYKEVNPEFGTLNDLKDLVEQAHKKDIAVILDWVANHTSWDNPWIVNKDWYTQDGNGNIISPPGTNWADVADLDYSNAEMRMAMVDAMKYWVGTADIDGYRCDAADMVPFDFWGNTIASFKDFTEKKLIWLAEGARNDHFDAGFQMNYAWSFYDKLKDVFNGGVAATGIISAHLQEYASLAAGAQKLRFTTNHDESAWDATPMVLFGGEQGALAASVATIYLGGVPLIYGSQEVGVTENVPFFAHSPIDWTQNPGMLQAYMDILSFYNSSDALRRGSMSSYTKQDVLAFTRTGEDMRVFIMINVRNQPVNYDIPSEFENTTWTDIFGETSVTLPATIDLEAYEYLVLEEQ